jgi:hypothetical protein
MPSDAEAAHASRGEDGYAPDALCIPSASNFLPAWEGCVGGGREWESDLYFAWAFGHGWAAVGLNVE